MAKFTFLLITVLLAVGCGGSKKSSAQRASAKSAGFDSAEALARAFVTAVHKSDVQAAMKLLPTRSELRDRGERGPTNDSGYQRYLAKRRRGFARVVAKFKRKHPGGCKTLTFSRLQMQGMIGPAPVRYMPSINIFARCDGREIWLADPDGLFLTANGWKLMEFS